MCRLNKKNDGRRIDPCMRNITWYLKRLGVQTVACCCGHGKYPMTIVIRYGLKNKEIFKLINIPRKKRLYKKDKQGYYYIPETLK